MCGCAGRTHSSIYDFRLAAALIMAWLSAAATRAESPAASGEFSRATGILYREGPALTEAMLERCRLDIDWPRQQTGYATIVWFHGGGLTGGERGIPTELQGRGLAVVAPSYRLHPQVTAPAYIEDAAAAVAWTFHHIADYGGSPARIYVGGHSAGGYLASMVTLDPRWLAAHDIPAQRIAGLASYSGHSITHFTIRKERGISDRQPIVDELAPLFHVRSDAPPILLLTGDRERELLGRYEETAYFWRMLKLAGHEDVTLRELPGTDHGGMAEPGHPLFLQWIAEHDRQPE
jgi:acetyl esterase/lipase